MKLNPETHKFLTYKDLLDGEYYWWTDEKQKFKWDIVKHIQQQIRILTDFNNIKLKLNITQPVYKEDIYRNLNKLERLFFIV